MAKTCVFTGKKAVFGNRKKYRGKAKYLGGVGKKILGTSRRKFKPNLQKVPLRRRRRGEEGLGVCRRPSAAAWSSSRSRSSRSQKVNV